MLTVQLLLPTAYNQSPAPFCHGLLTISAALGRLLNPDALSGSGNRGPCCRGIQSPPV